MKPSDCLTTVWLPNQVDTPQPGLSLANNGRAVGGDIAEGGGVDMALLLWKT